MTGTTSRPDGWSRDEDNEMDVALTGQGDLVISPYGDLFLLGDEAAIQRQRMAFAMFVNAPDYALYPEFGANLEDLLGRPLDETTLDIGVELIINAVPEVEDVYGVLNDRYNSIVFFIRHPAFKTMITLVFALDRGLLVGEEAENLLHEIFIED
jgi:hypothetical protein